jgi:hypothetical protein
MRKMLSRHRPSPALLVAVIAVALAVSGVAVGLPGKRTIDRNDFKKGAVTKRAIKKGAVRTGKIANKAVTTGKIAGGAVTKGKIAGSAVASGKVQDASLKSRDLAPGVLTVVAFGQITDPVGIEDPSLANDVGLSGVTEGTGGGLGETRVFVNSSVIPGGDVSKCTVLTTLRTDAQPSGSLGSSGLINVAVGGALAANEIQVQTRDDTGSLADRSYNIQVTCPA